MASKELKTFTRDEVTKVRIAGRYPLKDSDGSTLLSIIKMEIL